MHRDSVVAGALQQAQRSWNMAQVPPSIRPDLFVQEAATLSSPSRVSMRWESPLRRAHAGGAADGGRAAGSSSAHAGPDPA